MDDRRFADLAEAWGGDIALWPAETQAPARAMVAQSGAARRALEDARALDALLAQDTAPVPDDALMARILADAATVAAAAPPQQTPAPAPERRRWLPRLGPVWGSALAGAMCLVLGLAAGAGVPAVDTLWTGGQTTVTTDVFDLALVLDDTITLTATGEDT